MMCLFETYVSVKTNEDFQKVVKKKMKIMGALILAGIIAILADGIAVAAGVLDSDSYQCGLYLGLGCGLIVAGIIKILQLRKICRNEELLKKERLKYTDERNRAISAKAISSAAMTILVVSYIPMLVGAIYSRIIFICFWSVIMGFLFLYFIFFKYYSRKM